MFKPIAWLLSLAPLAYLVYTLYQDAGANPIETITNFTGIWTLRFIVVTLAVSPLRWITGINQLVNYRRLVGLFAFFYGVLHFMTFFYFDHQFDIAGMFADVRLRPYITAGFVAFVLMIPLAITSMAGWIRRMGGRNWNLLHRLVYITALAAVLFRTTSAVSVWRSIRPATTPPSWRVITCSWKSAPTTALGSTMFSSK